jgi:hypothetical protein
MDKPEVLEMVSQASLGKPLQTFHGNLSDNINEPFLWYRRIVNHAKK